MTAARMAAMLTYRTRDSYERRFGRDIMPPPSSPTTPPSQSSITITAASTSSEIHRRNHNEGHRHQNSSAAPPPPPPPSSSIGLLTAGGSPKPFSGTATTNNQNTPANITSGHQPQVYSAHSYLRYQAAKFNERFDANCYIALSRKMDAHDVSYNRGPYEDVVRSIEQPVLVIGKRHKGQKEITSSKKGGIAIRIKKEYVGTNHEYSNSNRLGRAVHIKGDQSLERTPAQQGAFYCKVRRGPRWCPARI